MRIAERAILTLGLAKVMTRPPFNSLAPGIRLNFADRTAKSGNPNLEPFRANQFLAELVWALESGPRLSGEMKKWTSEEERIVSTIQGESFLESLQGTAITIASMFSDVGRYTALR